MSRNELISEKFSSIVILSGFLKTSLINGSKQMEWEDADRFFSGLDLFINKNIDYLVFTRGFIPWDDHIPEGEYLKEISLKLGIDKNQIFVSGLSKNTEDEAVSIKKMLDKKLDIVLVTSAFHMPRARYIFEKYNFNVHPYPVDFKYTPKQITLIDFFPSANSLYSISNSLRELLGRLYYHIKLGFFS